MYKYNSSSHSNAITMRRNMTREERHLWFDFLSTHQYKWRRQKLLGNYILDFYCPKLKLAIELDGNQHRNTNQAIEKDNTRTGYIRSQDIRLIRFSNLDITHNFNSVCEYIDNLANELTKLQTPPSTS